MEKNRIQFIDALRGYAILMMLQGHTVGVVLEEKWRSTDYWAYNTWNYMRGITAPAFLFSAGLILAYLFFSASPEKLAARIPKTAKRGLWLMVLGTVSTMGFSSTKMLLSGDWKSIEFYKGTSVLHIIGAALLLSAAVVWLSRGRRVISVVGLGLLGLVLFLGGPWIGSWESGVAVIDFFIVPREGTLFLLYPWLGHYFCGCLFGFWAAKRAWYRDVKTLVLIIAVGFLASRKLFLLHNELSLLGYFDGEKARVFQTTYDQLYRFGDVMILTGIVALLAHLRWLPKWLMACGRETLPIYLLHMLIVYSMIFGVGYSAFLSRALSPWETVWIAVATVGFFIGLAHQLPKLRQRFTWLKWVS
ncbi:MAG: heparan-alpha-glucosaminide N-acetyltransferase domain-containing protein [Akkermansiaceae bacterium]